MKSIIRFCSMFAFLLGGCQNIGTVEPRTTPTESQLINAIMTTGQLPDLIKTESLIATKRKDIINNASPSFIAKYTAVRKNYSSFVEFVTTSNTDDRKAFTSLWRELMYPTQYLSNLRDKQYTIIYNAVSSKYQITQDSFDKALYKILYPSRNDANSRMLPDCEQQARSNRDEAFYFCRSHGYDYGFSSEIAQDVYNDTLDECMAGTISAWC